MELHEIWRVLVDDEPFDPETNRMIEVRGDVAFDNRGARGAAAKVPGKLLIAFTHPRNEDGNVFEERIVIPDEQKLPGARMGMLYWGVDTALPADPASLFRQAEEADDDDLYDSLPGAACIWLYPLEEGEVALLSELDAATLELDGEKVGDGVAEDAVSRLV